MTNLIDYSESDFIAWQAEREAMKAEINRLKALTWTHAGEMDRLAAENYRLTNHVAALQNRLYLNNIPHDLTDRTHD